MKLAHGLRTRLANDRGYSMMEVVLVAGISMVIAAFAIPMSGSAIGSIRINGDARSVTNAVQLAKLRAASDFSKARLYVDRSAKSFHVETWNKTTNAWVSESGNAYLQGPSESFGFGSLSTPPPNTQGTIGQAAQCLTAAGAATANTACIVFNSRGVPVTDAAGASGSPTSAGALYITDGTVVYGTTVTATSIIQLWKTNPTTASWALQ
jgi:hypothetical protein